MANPMEKEHERELQRLRELEEKDLEVEAKRGRRPLEGLSRGPTNWTQDQDDSAAAEVHAHDEEESVNESERQARGEYPADPAVVGTPEQP